MCSKEKSWNRFIPARSPHHWTVGGGDLQYISVPAHSNTHRDTVLAMVEHHPSPLSRMGFVVGDAG